MQEKKFQMSNPEFTSLPNKPDNATINNSEITKNEKILIAFLLFVIGMFIIVAAQNILQKTSNMLTVNNSIIVGGYRRASISILFTGFDPIQYAFDIKKSEKINFKLPRNLGSYPEWSPDGQWTISSTYPEIYLMRADGSQRTSIPAPSYGEQITWSPDGKQIAYSARTKIIIINIECLLYGETCTPKSRVISTSKKGYPLDNPHWSPDGKQIIYSEAVDVYIHHIFVVNADGKSAAIDLTPYYFGAIRQLRWSPDGRKIVGVCGGLNGEISDICVINKDGSNLINLTHNTENVGVHFPRWSPDGKMIAYISNFTDKPIAGTCWEGCPYPKSIFIVNSNGGENAHLPLEDNVVINWFYWYQ